MVQYDDQDLLDQIDSLADGDKPPSGMQFNDCSETAALATVQRRFGDWTTAVREAGYVPRHQTLSEGELIEQIHLLADGDKPPSCMQFDDCSETAALATVQSRFGDWTTAVREAGYVPRQQSLSKDELIGQIDSLANGEKPPTAKEFRDCPDTGSVTAVITQFGSWSKGVEAAGYESRVGSYNETQLLVALQRAATKGDVERIKHVGHNRGDYPTKRPYVLHYGGVEVAAVRGSIDIDSPNRGRAVPLTKSELIQFVDSISEANPHDQAVALLALVTGCDPREHRWVAENGIETTETDSVVLYPPESERGSRSVSVGPLYNQLVKMFDAVTTGRLTNSTKFSVYPPGAVEAMCSLRRVSRAIDFDVNRSTLGTQPSHTGPRVLHRDLRCTHYLFERVRGASQAMLKRRLALSDAEIEHYHRYLDDDESGWTVKIEWRD